jgi:hypothetical protein
MRCPDFASAAPADVESGEQDGSSNGAIENHGNRAGRIAEQRALNLVHDARSGAANLWRKIADIARKIEATN